MGNPFAGLASGVGGFFAPQAGGRSQLEQQLQQFQLQQGFTGCNVAADSTSAATYTIDLGVPSTPQIASGPETALAWLDRRVEEMRVKL